VRSSRVIFTDDVRGVGPQAKACGSLTRRKAFWVVLSVSFTGGGRGGPGQTGECVPSALAKARPAETTAADRLEPTTGGAREATENVRGRSEFGQGSSSRKGAGGQVSAVPEERTKGALASNARNASPRQRGNPVVMRGTGTSKSSRPKLA